MYLAPRHRLSLQLASLQLARAHTVALVALALVVLPAAARAEPSSESAPEALPPRILDQTPPLPGLILTNEDSEAHADQIFIREFDAREGHDIEISIGGVPVNESGNLHCTGYFYADLHCVIPEVADCQAYNMSTLGHLNADGLCAVARSYPSPP